MEGKLLLGIISCVLVILLSGCAGIGVKTEMYRIDERQESQATHKTPLRCLFVDCNSQGVK